MSASSSTVQSPGDSGGRSAGAVCAGARPRLLLPLRVVLVREERPVAALAPAPVPRAARRVGEVAVSDVASGSVPARGALVLRRLVAGAEGAVAAGGMSAPALSSRATFAVVAFFATVVRTAFTVVLGPARTGQPRASVMPSSRFSYRHS